MVRKLATTGAGRVQAPGSTGREALGQRRARASTCPRTGDRADRPGRRGRDDPDRARLGQEHQGTGPRGRRQPPDRGRDHHRPEEEGDDRLRRPLRRARTRVRDAASCRSPRTASRPSSARSTSRARASRRSRRSCSTAARRSGARSRTRSREPVANAELKLFETWGNWSYEDWATRHLNVKSGEDGTFKMTGIPAREWTTLAIRVRKQGLPGDLREAASRSRGTTTTSSCRSR